MEILPLFYRTMSSLGPLPKNDDDKRCRDHWPNNGADGTPGGVLDALLTIREETESISIEGS